MPDPGIRQQVKGSAFMLCLSGTERNGQTSVAYSSFDMTIFSAFLIVNRHARFQAVGRAFRKCFAFICPKKPVKINSKLLKSMMEIISGASPAIYSLGSLQKCHSIELFPSVLMRWNRNPVAAINARLHFYNAFSP